MRNRGASVDSVYTHRAWTQTPRDQNGIGPVKFPLVSDFSKETARAYGVLDDETGAAHRGLFIIDPEGVLRYQVVTDMNVGRSVDETLRVLQSASSWRTLPSELEAWRQNAISYKFSMPQFVSNPRIGAFVCIRGCVCSIIERQLRRRQKG